MRQSGRTTTNIYTWRRSNNSAHLTISMNSPVLQWLCRDNAQTVTPPPWYTPLSSIAALPGHFLLGVILCLNFFLPAACIACWSLFLSAAGCCCCALLKSGLEVNRQLLRYRVRRYKSSIKNTNEPIFEFVVFDKRKVFLTSSEEKEGWTFVLLSGSLSSFQSFILPTSSPITYAMQAYYITSAVAWIQVGM